MKQEDQPKPRFYGRRHGRPLNEGRKKALVDMNARYGIALDKEEMLLGDIEPLQFFDDNDGRDVFLEVGFGNGEHLAAQALANPDKAFIGCEPFINGVSALYKTIKEEDIDNIRVWSDDVRPFFDSLKSNSLSRIFVLFPDPWPKTRHHKRRIINQDNLDKMARVLKKGALLRLATDHAGMAEWMLDECLAHSQFEWTAQSKDDWRQQPDDWLVQTRYQQKAKAGIVNWFIECRRV